MREHTMKLVHHAVSAKEVWFPLHCDVAEKPRKRQDPAALDAVEQAWSRWHDAVEQLRAWCDTDRSQALADYTELARLQVKAQRATDAAVKAARGRGKRVLDAIRAEGAEQKYILLTSRWTLHIGLGWPHCGEQVLLLEEAFRYGPECREEFFSGPAIYDHGGGVYQNSHSVAPVVDGQSGVRTLCQTDARYSLRWEPQLLLQTPSGDVYPGPCDPRGKIGMVVAARPDQPLPCPQPNDPNQVHLAEPHALAASDALADLYALTGVAVGEQIGIDVFLDVDWD